jgi:hypothetical protein
LPKLEFSSSGVRQREENRTLFFHLSLDQPRMEMLLRCPFGAENLNSVVSCLMLTAPRENVGGSIQRYFVGLFGICSGDACSWDPQSLLRPFCT